MAGEMKISFGFSKVSRKPSLKILQDIPKAVQYIDCLEDNSIKVIGGNENNEKATLVIPVKNESILRDKMIEICKARFDKNKTGSLKSNDNEVDVKALTLDELAAKEIIEDLKNDGKSVEEVKLSEIPLTSGSVAVGEVESRLEDYEAVPVEQFGLAVLRGMGWNPSMGVGKTARAVKPIETVLRPKGMALGADAAFKRPPLPQSAVKEILLMKVSASIKVVAGPYKNLYGKIESFDDATGRIIVRLTLQNNVISINENMVQLVTTEEFSRNSKVMNLREFNDFKDGKKTNVEERSDNKHKDTQGKLDKRGRQLSPNNIENSKRKNISKRDGKSSQSNSPRRINESPVPSPERSGISKGKNTDRRDGKSFQKSFSFRRRNESSDSSFERRVYCKQKNTDMRHDKSFERNSSRSKSVSSDSSPDIGRNSKRKNTDRKDSKFETKFSPRRRSEWSDSSSPERHGNSKRTNCGREDGKVEKHSSSRRRSESSDSSPERCGTSKRKHSNRRNGKKIFIKTKK